MISVTGLTFRTDFTARICGTLQWRHNERDGVSDHQPHDCLLNRLFRRRSKKTSKLRVTGLSAGNSPVTVEFPAQMASNGDNVSIWWRHHMGFCHWGKPPELVRRTGTRRFRRLVPDHEAVSGDLKGMSRWSSSGRWNWYRDKKLRFDHLFINCVERRFSEIAIEVKARMTNYIPQKIMAMITYPCPMRASFPIRDWWNQLWD